MFFYKLLNFFYHDRILGQAGRKIGESVGSISRGPTPELTTPSFCGDFLEKYDIFIVHFVEKFDFVHSAWYRIHFRAGAARIRNDFFRIPFWIRPKVSNPTWSRTTTLVSTHLFFLLGDICGEHCCISFSTVVGVQYRSWCCLQFYWDLAEVWKSGLSCF